MFFKLNTMMSYILRVYMQRLSVIDHVVVEISLFYYGRWVFFSEACTDL